MFDMDVFCLWSAFHAAYTRRKADKGRLIEKVYQWP